MVFTTSWSRASSTRLRSSAERARLPGIRASMVVASSSLTRSTIWRSSSKSPATWTKRLPCRVGHFRNRSSICGGSWKPAWAIAANASSSRRCGWWRSYDGGSASPAPPQVLLGHHLRQLKLPTFLREYDKVAAEAAREGLDHPRYLLRLAELELIDRERRMVERRIRAARFPAVKSFDTFDFTAIPSLN